jgi:hypothetical protein
MGRFDTHPILCRETAPLPGFGREDGVFLCGRSLEADCPAGETDVPTQLGIIHADPLKFEEDMPTATGAHSVAADPISNRVFVPLGAGTGNKTCPNGCIGIYRAVAPKGQ